MKLCVVDFFLFIYFPAVQNNMQCLLHCDVFLLLARTCVWTNSWVASDLGCHKGHITSLKWASECSDFNRSKRSPGWLTWWYCFLQPGPYFSIWQDVSSQDLAKFGAETLVVWFIASLWNWTSFWAAMLLRCLPNFRVIEQFQIQISHLRDFVRSYHKTSCEILKQGPGQKSQPLHWEYVIIY